MASDDTPITSTSPLELIRECLELRVEILELLGDGELLAEAREDLGQKKLFLEREGERGYRIVGEQWRGEEAVRPVAQTSFGAVAEMPRMFQPVPPSRSGIGSTDATLQSAPSHCMKALNSTMRRLVCCDAIFEKSGRRDRRIQCLIGSNPPNDIRKP